MSEENAKQIYFIRHGESTSNASRDKGEHIDIRKDSNLTLEGVRQAQKLAGRIKKIQIDKIYSSPYPRATQTADIIAKASKLDYEILDCVHERGNDNHKAHFKSLYKLNKEDGEDFESMLKRAKSTVKFIEKNPAKNIAVVSHGMFLRVLLAYIVLGKDLKQKQAEQFMRKFMTKNTGLTKFNVFEDSWMLSTWNNFDHL
jgi:probable phosphoglycerate mutase